MNLIKPLRGNVPHRSLKAEDLLLVELDPLLGCLPESDGVVHLYSRIEKTLSEAWHL